MSVPHRPATLFLAFFLALAVAPAAPASAGAQDPPATLKSDSLTAHKDDRSPGIRATLSVYVPRKKDGGQNCLDVWQVGVAVRPGGQGSDYSPSINEKTEICSGAHKVFTTEPKTLPPGATYYGYYLTRDKYGKAEWHSLTKEVPVTVTPKPDFTTGREHVFDEDFRDPEASQKRWNNTKSGAYEWNDKLLGPNDKFGTINPKDNKLDRITPGRVTVANGQARFTAKPDGPSLPPVKDPNTGDPLPESCGKDKNPEKNPEKKLDKGNPDNKENVTKSWNTGLLTTQDSRDPKFRGGFTVQPGDYVETHVELPTQKDSWPTGAWPALWTWGARNPEKLPEDPGKWEGDKGEVDSFEYHPGPDPGMGNPHLLELTNRVRKPNPTAHYTDTRDIAPGKWVKIGTYYGRDSVDWYVNDVKVFSDKEGVPEGWKAYLILNLSVSGNCYGRQPQPKDKGEIGYSADYVHVWR
ncbi:hypothetical protein AB0B50_44605 [Streptomyces sp. NPDC041068]|uniref:hypothetical protein n=1 Tax=Streptomyces sp. NPDC041068 TaxID=3155130 RepID=UPI0033D426AD